MKIQFDYQNKKISIECDDNCVFGDDIQELFSRMLVVAGFPPSVIKLAYDDGSYVYLAKNEKVVEAEDGD